MADIELVIKIPEDVYTKLFDNGIQDNEIATDDICEMARSLRQGTPLPKNHGRLIDADALKKLCYEHEIGSAFDGEPVIAQGQYDDGDNIWKSLFDFAPTIIEADKTKSEDKE